MKTSIEIGDGWTEARLMTRLFQIIDGSSRHTPTPLFDVFTESAQRRTWQIDHDNHWRAELKGRTLTVECVSQDALAAAIIPWLICAVGSESQKNLLRGKLKGSSHPGRMATKDGPRLEETASITQAMAHPLQAPLFPESRAVPASVR